MSTSARNDSHRPQLCRLSCSSITNTPTLEYRILGCFGDLEKPLSRNSEIFHWCTHAESDSRLFLQKWSKSVQDKWPKGRVALITEKTRFGTLRRNLWGDFPIFLVSVCNVPPHLCSKFHPDRFRFGEVITEKRVHESPK